MKYFLTFLFSFFIAICVAGQVAEMNWELDYQIYLKLSNDSNYTYDISEVFHVTDTKTEISSDYVFYPVNPGKDFAQKITGKTETDSAYKTLWSALHDEIGGGWVHFTNCIAYALETRNLDLTAPLMKRPQTNWKPNPVTESFKRTRKWEYYVPVDQKNAIKEYKTRIKEGNAGDIHSIPKSYIDLFLQTSNKDYIKLKETNNYKQVAKIDLIKLLLGANYLGEAQITYVSNAVLNAVQNYSASKLPSVIIFDEYDAAAAMSLRAEGYRMESVVFKSSAKLTEKEMEERKKDIERIISDINKYNSISFKRQLGSYYQD